MFESIDDFVTNPLLLESYTAATLFCDKSNKFDNDYKKSILILIRYYYCKIF